MLFGGRISHHAIPMLAAVVLVVVAAVVVAIYSWLLYVVEHVSYTYIMGMGFWCRMCLYMYRSPFYLFFLPILHTSSANPNLQSSILASLSLSKHRKTRNGTDRVRMEGTAEYNTRTKRRYRWDGTETT